MRASKPLALIITSTFIILNFFLVFYIFESPLKYHNTHYKKYAVIAIRDDVNSFQKFATRLFTIPYLNKKYNKVIYYTQNYKDEYKENFTHDLTKLLTDYDSVDIFLLAHGNSYYTWITEVDSNLLNRIRLVYNSGCSGSLQDWAWENIGVHNYVAHRSNISISPVFYFYFLRRYCNGYTIEKAVNESNFIMHKRLGRIKMLTFGYAFVDPIVEKESEGKIVVKQ